MKPALSPAALLCILVLSTGFKPFDNAAEDIVEEFESSFQARNQFEYYEIIRITEDNRIHRGGMLLIYEYGDGAVRGLWRIVESSPDLRPATLLCIQNQDSYPKLFLYDPAGSVSGEIDGNSRKTQLSSTDWHLEDIYDNDKETGRVFVRDGNDVVRGEYVFKIRSRYTDPVMRQQSVYGEGVAYFTASDKRFTRLELLDKSNNLFKTISPDNPINLGDAETPRYRPRVIDIANHRQQTRTLLVLKKAIYNIDRHAALFTPEFAKNWDAEQDRKILDRLKPLAEF